MKLPGEELSAALRVRYIWGATIVWAALWIGTAVVLKGGGTFADMIPLLTIGTGWFIAVVPAQLATPTTTAQGATQTERPVPDESQP